MGKTKNMNAKGGRGVKKRIFKGGAKKRKYNVDLVDGSDVIFECRQSVYIGRGATRIEEGLYSVHSENYQKEHTVSWQAHPVMLHEHQVSTADLTKGDTYFFVWQVLDDYLQLIPAQVVEVLDEYVWMKPDPNLHDGCLKVDAKSIYRINRDKHELHDNIDIDITVNHDEVNVAWLLLQATQTQLDNLSVTYTTTLQKLQQKCRDNNTLQNQIDMLNQINQDATKAVKDYREKLVKSQSLNQAANTLYSIIAAQKDSIDAQEKQLVESDRIVGELQTAYRLQTQRLIEATVEVDELQRENTALKDTISTMESDHQQEVAHLKDESNKLNENVQTMTEEKKTLFKLSPSSANHVSARPAESQKRGANCIYIPRPTNSSSSADRRTLQRRAGQVDQVLKAISAKENPSSEDIITTLAAYLRRHPEIAIPACQSAKITFSQELNTKEVVDLKVLLKLPMNRLRDLRRFLSNHNIKLFPSERHIYNELRARQTMSPEVVEIGVLQLHKTAHGPVTGVAFARVKNLREYLTDVINKQTQNGNTWTHQAFNDEIWLKIGGDKGGSSTKLAAQFVNQRNGNSSDATNMLAMINATDTYHNMSEAFSLYYDQFAELMTVKNLLVNGIEKPLRIFLYGDYEFLCKYIGHMGPSSSYPCLWCNINLQELRKPMDGTPHCPNIQANQWSPNANWPKPRSAEQYVQDYADLSADTSNRPVTGHMYHSISKKPLFPLCAGVDHIVPPSLHILLGLVVRYFNLVELECRKLDQGGLEEKDLEQYAEWRNASEQAKVLEIEFSEAKAALDADEKLLESFNRAKRGRNTQGLGTDPCSMPLCALASSVPAEIDRNKVQWIRCTQCGKGNEIGWYHAYCVGIKETEIDLPCYNDWVCQVCQEEISGPDDVIPCQEERVNSNRALVMEKEREYSKAKDNLDKIHNDIVKARGNYEKMLNERLENDLRVKRQAYHSQCFVGNHCKIIVDNSEVLLQDLPDGEMKTKFQGLFGRLRKIFKLFKADFLTEAEINELCVRCWELGYFFPKNFPGQSIPPKLHILICHIPEIAKKWKTIGLLSEQGLESIHASVNAIARMYVTVREQVENMRLVFACKQVSNATAKTGLEVPPDKVRVCQGDKNCKGRYATSADKKTRICKKCEHVIVLEKN